MRAWHFCEIATDGVYVTSHGGLPVVVGETLRHDGPLVPCKSGLHASIRAIDALRYASGPVICRVECGGDVIRGEDKIACSERTVIWAYDATQVLRRFARRWALGVIHPWDAPEVVVRYLRTGDESIRVAANDAAFAAWIAFAAWDAVDADMEASRAAARAAWTACRETIWAAGITAGAAQNRRLERMIRDGRPR